MATGQRKRMAVVHRCFQRADRVGTLKAGYIVEEQATGNRHASFVE